MYDAARVHTNQRTLRLSAFTRAAELKCPVAVARSFDSTLLVTKDGLDNLQAEQVHQNIHEQVRRSFGFGFKIAPRQYAPSNLERPLNVRTVAGMWGWHGRMSTVFCQTLILTLSNG